MELQSDRKEIAVRLLQNGKYVWTITVNASLSDPSSIEQLKQIDKSLKDAFPNHVTGSSMSFKEIE
jgi:hypothetical protein